MNLKNLLYWVAFVGVAGSLLFGLIVAFVEYPLLGVIWLLSAIVLWLIEDPIEEME